MKFKYIILIILIVALAGAGIGLKMFFKPHADVSKMKASFSMKATVLIEEFQKDEMAATSKYSEKVLQITGKLAAKSKLENGNDLLTLEDEMQGISCLLDSSWAAINQETIDALEAGCSVTVKGICKGYLMEIKVNPAVVVK